MAGFLLLHRRVYSNPVFTDTIEAGAFVWMTAQAAWQPYEVRYKSKRLTLERGQFAISLRDLASKFSWSVAKARRYLTRLETDTMIEVSHDTGVNIITICNYEKYQNIEHAGETPIDTLDVTFLAQQRHSSGTQKEKDKQLNTLKKVDGAVFQDRVIEAAGLQVMSCITQLHVITKWKENTGLTEDQIINDVARIRADKITKDGQAPSSLRYYDACFSKPRTLKPTKPSNAERLKAL